MGAPVLEAHKRTSMSACLLAPGCRVQAPFAQVVLRCPLGPAWDSRTIITEIVEPARGFEPLTCAIRVLFREVSRVLANSPRSLKSASEAAFGIYRIPHGSLAGSPVFRVVR